MKVRNTHVGRALSACLTLSLLVVVGVAQVSTAATRSPNTRAPQAHLCRVLPRVDRLTVTRRAPGHGFQFTFPAVVSVTDAHAARAVASAACALAPLPTGIYECPAAFAVSYRLDFAIKGEKGMGGEALELFPTGCPMVKGLGVARTPTARFYRILARAMGLSSGDSATFRGVATP